MVLPLTNSFVALLGDHMTRTSARILATYGELAQKEMLLMPYRLL